MGTISKIEINSISPESVDEKYFERGSFPSESIFYMFENRFIVNDADYCLLVLLRVPV